LLEQYFNDGLIEHSSIVNSIKNRRIFPCFVGSALKLDGIESFLLNLDEYTICPQYSTDFSARVYKISRDKQGNRLTHVKLTGGSLKVKEQVKPDEKVDQIRIYSGDSCEMVHEISAGRICAFTGLESTYAGENLGSEFDSLQPVLTPVLNYAFILPEGCDTNSTYLKLKQLEEEQPELHIIWNKSLGEIHAQVMGDVQIEILKSIIHDRFQLDIEFGIGNIVYKETILNEVVGCGHYEPLRHYAEVRLLMEPAPRGSGLIFESKVSEDILDRNWQRLIMTHLEEKTHKGVLTGSDITDIKITIINGRAHNKHTEGGDFRQATYRAVRQGLKKALCQLLEPVYEFQLEVPSEHVGRAMSDIQFMHGNFEPMTMDGDTAIIKGVCPVATMRNYQKEVAAYTKGNGILFCTLKGYEPCHNSEFVINEINYDSEKDIENPTGSVFCDHGAGFVVPWHKVDEYMHTEFKQKREASSSVATCPTIDTEEIDEILARTFYANRKMDNYQARTISAPQTEKRIRKHSSLPEILLVDGYNIIFAWKELKELAEVNIDGARGKLTDILCNYQGYRKNIIILVFDGYKVPGNPGEIIKHHNIYIIYTKEAETADQYIEKAVHDISSKYDIKVATSDAMEQLIIMGQGALRISAQELYQEVLITNQEMQERHMEQTKKSGSYLFEVLTDDMADFMDDVRMGRREFEDLETK